MHAAFAMHTAFAACHRKDKNKTCKRIDSFLASNVKASFRQEGRVTHGNEACHTSCAAPVFIHDRIYEDDVVQQNQIVCSTLLNSKASVWTVGGVCDME